jgi:uncharacterized membrane protein YbaN (DUF454 family)
MRRRVKHWAMLALGWGFMVLGVLGLFLPILQGVLFLCIGTIILSRRSVRVRWLILKAGQRWPKFRVALEKARIRAARLRWRLGLRRRYDG